MWQIGRGGSCSISLDSTRASLAAAINPGHHGVGHRFNFGTSLGAPVGGVIELRKIADQDTDSQVSRRKAKQQLRYPRVTVPCCVVVKARAH